MNVSLTPELEKFIAEEIMSGKYSSAEGVILEGLRLLREHKEQNGTNARGQEAPTQQAVFDTRTPAERAKAWRDWATSHDPNTPVILDDRREALYGDDGR